MSDTFIDMSDTMIVVVEHEEPEEPETWAEIADPFTKIQVADPIIFADAHGDLTDCVVILTAL